MKWICNIVLFLLPVLAFCQKEGQRYAENNVVWEERKSDFRVLNNTYTFCDTDSDGVMPIDLESIKNDVLGENIDQFGTEEGIYICTRIKKVHLITDINGTPQKTTLCTNFPGAVGTSGGFLDIAINQEGDRYVAMYGKIFKVDNTMCAGLEEFNLNVNGGITALSFDRSHNLYLGGFDTFIYRLDSGNYNVMNQWHDFGEGYASGDFVMCGDKMYVAWNASNGCRLFEVTVDANTNYISHIDLGQLPDNTFGLASELGNLYGVTQMQLYKINRNPLTFNVILNNDNPSDNWYGAAGKHEAVNFEVKVFETLQNAQNNVNPLPPIWTNTIPFGQMVYVVIRNMVNNQIATIPVQLVINVAPTFTSPIRIVHCEGDTDANVFDIRATESGIKGPQQYIIVSYHSTSSDADNNVNSLPDVLTINGNADVVYVRLTNAITTCYSTFDFALEVTPRPNFNRPPDLILCAQNSAFVDLNVQIPAILGAQDSNDIQITFHGSFADAFSGSHSLAIPYQMSNGVKEIFVRIENTSSHCFDTGSFEVKIINENHDFTLHYQVETDDWTYDENSIQVQTNGNYEYSLDGIKYQDNPYFGYLSIGAYELHVRDKDNCSVSLKDVFLLMYPKYFTPNGDSYHDTWNIILASYEPKMEIEIYDRYGKVITTLYGASIGWDGTLNGKQLPATDYWFTVKRESGKQFKGHFTLKR